MSSVESTEETLLTVESVSEKLAVSKSSVKRLMDNGDLKSVKVLGSRRISSAALRDYLEGLKSK